jgi:hypothetical protein
MTLHWCGLQPRTEEVEMTVSEFEELLSKGRTDGRGSAVERVELYVGTRSQANGTEP